MLRGDGGRETTRSAADDHEVRVACHRSSRELRDDCRADRNRAFDADDLVATRTNTDIGDLRLDKGLDAVEIPSRLGRKIGQVSRRRRTRFPALEPLVAWHRARKQIEIAGEL